jgi:hypothetical protein
MTFTIDRFLAVRKTRRIGASGDPVAAQEHLALSKLIANNYLAYDALRIHLHAPGQHPAPKKSAELEIITEQLFALGWIVEAKGKHGFRLAPKCGGSVKQYLFGHWLEEYSYCAFLEAGADEAYYSQKVEWTVDGVTGKNEMDVVARKGETVVFASCKSIRPLPKAGIESEMLAYFRELHDWDEHFSAGKATAVIISTLDLELEREAACPLVRYPILTAKGKVLEVMSLGLEHLSWHSLVAELGNLLRREN